jgi:hypothetical protein
MGVINHLVGMFPGDIAIGALVISPREKLDDPGRAHLPHQLQGSFDFPLLYFVSEARVHAGNGMITVDRL